MPFQKNISCRVSGVPLKSNVSPSSHFPGSVSISGTSASLRYIIKTRANALRQFMILNASLS